MPPNRGVSGIGLGDGDDVEVTAGGSLIAIAKRIRTLLGGTGSIRLTDGTTTVAVMTGAPTAATAALIVKVAPTGVALGIAPTIVVGARGVSAILDGVASYRALSYPFIFTPLNAIAVNPAAAIWTPVNPGVSGAVRLMGYHLSGDVEGRYLLRNGAAGTTIDVVNIVFPYAAVAAPKGITVTADFGPYGILLTQGNVLECLGPAASTISGMVWGIEEGISV